VWSWLGDRRNFRCHEGRRKFQRAEVDSQGSQSSEMVQNLLADFALLHLFVGFF
jgi:hypothetical protein